MMDIKSFKKHIENMQSGAKLYLNWFQDILLSGASFQDNIETQSEHISKQMVNAGMQKVGKSLRTLTSSPSTDPNQSWGKLTDIAILCQSIRQIDHLNPHQQYDLLVQAGMSQKKSLLLESLWKKESWVCLHIDQNEFEGIYEQKAYFQHLTNGKIAYFSEFLFRSKRFKYSWKVGRSYHLKYQFFPADLPMRIDIKEADQLASKEFQIQSIEGFNLWHKFLLKKLNETPYFNYYFAIIANLYLVATANNIYLHDPKSKLSYTLDEKKEFERLYPLVFSNPFTIFAIWEKGSLVIKSIILPNQIINLKPAIWTHSLNSH